MNIDQIEVLRAGMQESIDLLVDRIKKIQIGTKEQFPFGWRRAAKGRTVWRILEELITQNLEQCPSDYGLQSLIPASSEVSIYDFECKISGNETPIFINIKSALLGGKRNKDDISKGVGLKDFLGRDASWVFLIATFFIKFNDDMTIEIDHATVFPLAWIKDIYVNPSNNGNLQSAYYKDLDYATPRNNDEFYELLCEALEVASSKKNNKRVQNVDSIDTSTQEFPIP